MLKLTKTLTSTCATDHNQSYDQGRGATELLGNCFIVTSGNPKYTFFIFFISFNRNILFQSRICVVFLGFTVKHVRHPSSKKATANKEPSFMGKGSLVIFCPVGPDQKYCSI